MIFFNCLQMPWLDKKKIRLMLCQLSMLQTLMKKWIKNPYDVELTRLNSLEEITCSPQVFKSRTKWWLKTCLNINVATLEKIWVVRLNLQSWTESFALHMCSPQGPAHQYMMGRVFNLDLLIYLTTDCYSPQVPGRLLAATWDLHVLLWKEHHMM